MGNREREYKTQIRPSLKLDTVLVLESFKDVEIKGKSTIGEVIEMLLSQSPQFKERLDKFNYNNESLRENNY